MRNRCVACRNRIIDFDYKDPGLSRYLSPWGKIRTKKETRLCAKHQRNLAAAVKRARFLALLPYSNR